MNGLVMKSTGSWYDVLTDGGEVLPCRLRGQFRIHGIKSTNPVVVGDHVTVEREADGTATIVGIETRRNYIERKSTNLSKISHVIAANIDVCFLMVTLKEPRTSLGFIDRFLVSAEGFRIPVCLVFNKMDLYDDKELAVVERLSALYEQAGYETLRTSAKTGLGIEELHQRMTGKVSLFSGHSGTGKSALIHCIDPSLDIWVGEISKQHLNGLIQYSKEEVRDYFPEIRAYNNQCRFDNCIHWHEPDCAVRQAVAEGRIAESRYMNYLSILTDDDMKVADWQLE